MKLGEVIYGEDNTHIVGEYRVFASLVGLACMVRHILAKRCCLCCVAKTGTAVLSVMCVTRGVRCCLYCAIVDRAAC